MPGRKKRLFMEHNLPRLATAQPSHEENPANQYHRVQGVTRGAGVPVSPDYDTLLDELHLAHLSSPGLAEQLQALEERHARYEPVLRFILLDPKQRRFGSQRMCYRGSIDGWLELGQSGSVTTLARALIPTLGSEQFFELWWASDGAGVAKHYQTCPPEKRSNPGTLDAATLSTGIHMASENSYLTVC
jgi:hypothetical protein